MRRLYFLFCIPILLAFTSQSPIKEVEMHLGGNEKIHNTEEETCFGCGDCSVYCAIENEFTILSSSTLNSQDKNTYDAKNIDDYNLQTAWIEGVKGNGIGEWIEFKFDKQSFINSGIKINGLYLYNGYRKNEKTWKENSRIKKLKITINNKDFLIVNLHDVVNQQSLEFDELNLSEIQSIRFTIIEIFKGEIYDDTALSELRLNGSHHH